MERLPATVCFRITRYCNARCGFCLAPPDGAHPPASLLMQRMDWLAAHGVRCLHFCGGEPTIHPGLAELLRHGGHLGLASRLTSNGIKPAGPLVPALLAARTRVKLSLHGDRAHHDAMVGRPAFDAVCANLRCLQSAGVPVGLQTTLVAGGAPVLDWMVDFCLAHRVPQLCLLPFIPRGNGQRMRGRYALAPGEREALREAVRRRRQALRGRLDVRWLDFSAKAVPVAEADGRVVLERAAEALDTVLCTMPGWTEAQPQEGQPLLRIEDARAGPPIHA